MGRAQRWYLHHSLLALSRALADLGIPLALRTGTPAVEVTRFAASLGAATVFWTRREKPRPRRVEDAVTRALLAARISPEPRVSELIIHPDEVTSPFDDFHSYMGYWLELVRAHPPDRPAPAPVRADMPPVLVSFDDVPGTSVDGLGLLRPSTLAHDSGSVLYRRFSAGAAAGSSHYATSHGVCIPVHNVPEARVTNRPLSAPESEHGVRRSTASSHREASCNILPSSTAASTVAATALRAAQGLNRPGDVDSVLGGGALADCVGGMPGIGMDPSRVGCIAAEDVLRAFVSGPRFVRFADGSARRDGMLLADRQTTSRLSPHIRFGELSPRLVFHSVVDAGANAPEKDSDTALEAARAFLKNMCLRDFGYYMLTRHPDAACKPIVSEYNYFPWATDVNGALTTSWRTGTTGYPIIDAAMRQLAQEGWLHNRMRYLVASFFCKYLLLPWHIGAAYLVYGLVDGDEACNSLGWQWIAGCNSDAIPSNRLVNPVAIAGNGVRVAHDAADYIRKYVPELAGLPDHLVFEPWAASRQELRSAGVELLDRSDYGTAISAVSTQVTSLTVSPAAAAASWSFSQFCYPARIIDGRAARFRARQSINIMRRVFQAYKVRRTIVEDSSLPSNRGAFHVDRERCTTSGESRLRSTKFSDAFVSKGGIDNTKNTRFAPSNIDDMMIDEVREAETDWTHHEDTHSAAESLSLLSGAPSGMGAVTPSLDGRYRKHRRVDSRGVNDALNGSSESHLTLSTSETNGQSAAKNRIASIVETIVEGEALSQADGDADLSSVPSRCVTSRNTHVSGIVSQSVLPCRPGRPISPDVPALEARERTRGTKRPRSALTLEPSELNTPYLADTGTPSTRRVAVSSLLSPDMGPSRNSGTTHQNDRGISVLPANSSLPVRATPRTELAPREHSRTPFFEESSVRPRRQASANEQQGFPGEVLSPGGLRRRLSKTGVADHAVSSGLQPYVSTATAVSPVRNTAVPPHSLQSAFLHTPLQMFHGVQPGVAMTRGNSYPQNPQVFNHSVPGQYGGGLAFSSQPVFAPPTRLPHHSHGTRPDSRDAGTSSMDPNRTPHQTGPSVARSHSPGRSDAATRFVPRHGAQVEPRSFSAYPNDRRRNSAPVNPRSRSRFDSERSGTDYMHSGPGRHATAAGQDLCGEPPHRSSRTGSSSRQPTTMHRSHVATEIGVHRSQQVSPHMHAQSPPSYPSTHQVPYIGPPSGVVDTSASPQAGRYAPVGHFPMSPSPYGMVPSLLSQGTFIPHMSPQHPFVQFSGHVPVGGERLADASARSPSSIPQAVPIVGSGNACALIPGNGYNGSPPIAPGRAEAPSQTFWQGPTTRYEREQITRRMAAMDYSDALLGGKHREQWQAIALHLLKEYEFTDETERQTSKDYVRLCVLKDELRSSSSIRITVNHVKDFFRILNLVVTTERDRRGHGGVRGPYVYGIRPVVERSQSRQ